jgi:glycosyltransferase involved in cell wall biosynthesis
MIRHAGLTVIETHPVQYHAPVYRALQQRFGIPVTVIYGSDFSVTGYRDREFGASFAWDTDLLDGYNPVFLSRVAQGGAQSFATVKTAGLAAALHRSAPAAVLLLGYSPRFYHEAIWYMRRGAYPLLFRGETTDHARRRTGLKQMLRDRLLSWLYHSCAALLYIGQRSRDHFRRLRCPEERLIFSPYCVDTSAFALGEAERMALRQHTRATLGLADHQLVLLFSGKLAPRKRPDLLFQAVDLLDHSLRERMALLFVGDGALRDQLRATATAMPQIPAHFCGFQNQRTLSQYYHAADLLVLPSEIGETWGLVVNEALYHGLPCIVSDMVGCAPDLVEASMTGEVFANGSAHGLARALERALNLVGRLETRERCRQRAEQYSVERAAYGIAMAYAMALEHQTLGVSAQ